MKKVLSVLLSICMMSLMFGCSAEPKEQSATYVLTEEEAGMFTMTDTQTLRARGDIWVWPAEAAWQNWAKNPLVPSPEPERPM